MRKAQERTMQHRRCHTSRAACEAAHAGRSEPRARSWEHSGGFWSDPGQGRSLALRGPNVHPPPTGPTARAYSPAPKPTRQTLAPGHHPGRATPVPPSLSVRSNICRRRPPAQFRPLPPEPCRRSVLAAARCGEKSGFDRLQAAHSPPASHCGPVVPCMSPARQPMAGEGQPAPPHRGMQQALSS